MDSNAGLRGSIVEEEIELTTVELCHACGTSVRQVEVWVVEGVLHPRGSSREEWRFGGDSLGRMKVATRLARDLELNEPGVALALDLLARIEALEARLKRSS